MQGSNQKRIKFNDENKIKFKMKVFMEHCYPQ